MGVEEMIRFFAWLEETYGPEEVLELPEATEEHLSSMIESFRSSRIEKEK